MFKRKISPFMLCLVIIFLSLFLNGCAQKPYLTQDNSYVILSISPTGTTQSELLELPWNANMAIMQKFLLECSFVLSDLETPTFQDSSYIDHRTTTILQSNLPEPKLMTFMIDQHALTLEVQSVQIEVAGANVGQVTLNHTLILQGINDPNLQPSFEALNEMLHDAN